MRGTAQPRDLEGHKPQHPHTPPPPHPGPEGRATAGRLSRARRPPSMSTGINLSHLFEVSVEFFVKFISYINTN
jgi:hypothetical protein